jgi:hypothetical protein
VSDEHSRTSADVIELEARRKGAASEQPIAPKWTIAKLRQVYAPAFKSLPFIQRKNETSIFEKPITFWNDAPGFDHKTDFKRGRLFAEMTIEAIAADNCGSGPLEATFAAIIKDAVARKAKGGKHTRTLPPAVDGFLWELSKFIAKAASCSGGGNDAA